MFGCMCGCVDGGHICDKTVNFTQRTSSAVEAFEFKYENIFNTVLCIFIILVLKGLSLINTASRIHY